VPGPRRSGFTYTAAVKMFRRVLLVLGVAGAIGAIARLRGKGELPATEGGWRELDGPEFR
jgi:hypothetical protein